MGLGGADETVLRAAGEDLAALGDAPGLGGGVGLDGGVGFLGAGTGRPTSLEIELAVSPSGAASSIEDGEGRAGGEASAGELPGGGDGGGFESLRIFRTTAGEMDVGRFGGGRGPPLEPEDAGSFGGGLIAGDAFDEGLGGGCSSCEGRRCGVGICRKQNRSDRAEVR